MTPCYYCEADDDACKTCIHSDTYIDPQEEITKLREQVAAQAAVIEKLREGLKVAGMNCVDDFIAAGALQLADTIPTDSTQILDEVRKQERERCAKVCEELRHPDGFSGENVDWCAGTDHCAAAIRAME